jgi:hypothetical protein
VKASALVLLVACSDYGVEGAPPVPPAEPPPDEDEFGDPPDWNDCLSGWHGQYVNFSVEDTLVNPPRSEEPEADPYRLDWWDDVAFEQFDPSLDFGENWWPVDEGLDADPQFFGVHWRAWIRTTSGVDVTLTLGSKDDSWVALNETVIASDPGIHPFLPTTYSAYIESGQYPIEVFYAHRKGASSGFQFRFLTGDLQLCYADYSEQTEE